jgi:SAM-dependent methyltransferase
MDSTDTDFNRVEAHYAQRGLESTILAALVAAGKDPAHLKPDDLAPIDEFHICGRKATLELAREIHPDKSMQVLDVGSGLGGASRCLALEFGCHVIGLDLTEEYCRVATMLTHRLGLDSLVSYLHGNALHMPFADATFDLLWTQHASMNISDKGGLYREMWRVLKPGGVLASYDVLAGTGGAVYFPVPWAREPSISFLMTPQQMRNTLESTGFEVLVWRDTTEAGRAWFRRLGEKISQEGTPPLGLHLLLGPDFRQMAHNQVRNLEEDRIAILESVARRPKHSGEE